MRWIVLCIILALLAVSIPFLLPHREPGEGKVLFPTGEGKILCSNSQVDRFNDLLREELIKRMPPSRTVQVRHFPTLAVWHRMTGSLKYSITVPSIETQNPQEALDAFVPYAQAYVDTINNIPTIRPYLCAFPMPLPMWEICMGFAEDEKTHLPLYDPNIASIIFCGREFEIIHFYRERTRSDGVVVHNSYYNTYDVSKGIPEVIKQMEVPRFDPVEKKTPQTIPEANKYRYPADDMKPVYHFCKEFAKQNGLVFIAFEDAFLLDFCHPPVFSELVFATQNKTLSLEEARELALKVQREQIKFYVEKIGLDENGLDEYFRFLRREKRGALTNPVNVQDFMSFRLTFWDECIDRVKAPYIAEIRVFGSKVRYYVADELQRLQLLHEESMPSYELDVP